MIPTVILAGGTGTRLKEMSEFLPKPLIPIGGKPMVVHIMKHFSHYGFKDFILALGFKQEAFKMYFTNYDIINNDITVDVGRYKDKERYHSHGDQWKVTLADTGENTLKGGRLKRIEKYIEGDTFFCCYGDGLSDIHLTGLLEFHKSHGKLATITGVHPPPRFGEIVYENRLMQDGYVKSFSEKPHDDNYLINGGYFVFNRGIFDYLTPNEWCDLEFGTLELIANKGEMMCYHHKGFWRAIDTLKDLGDLQAMWDKGEAGWKIWE